MPETHPAVVISIWLAVLAWGWVMLGRCRGRESPGALGIWILGWLAFVVHVGTAFGIHYRGSHAVALAETARQTLDLTGFDSGVGLWLNYLFGFVWAVEALRWAHSGEAVLSGRWRRTHRVMMTFLAFMVFNGAVVFVSGPMRGFGILLFAGLAVAWLRSRSQPSQVPDPTLSDEKDRPSPPSS